MAQAKITVDDAELKRMFRRLNLKARNSEASIGIEKALDRGARRVQVSSTTKQIIRGGGRNAPVHPTQLTSRTGSLRRSIRINKTARFIRAIGTDLIYGGAHEDPQSGQRPRPFLKPALAEEIDAIRNDLAREIQRAIDRS